jgi:Concanavalin A-like lectin/glucanases superfamily/Secretion system C-terminal sorting domain
MITKIHIKLNLILAILLILSTRSFGQVDLNNGLVGYFPFSGNPNDESVSNIDGTLNNATLTIGINDNPDSAYYFNGIDANINCSSDNRNILDTVTISAWFKTTSSDLRFIVGKYDWTIDKGFYLAIKNEKVIFDGRNNGGGGTQTSSTSLINDGNWHHVMGVVHSNTWELWVDCQLDTVAYANSPNPDLTNSEPLTIGNYNMGDNGDHFYFLGSIDEVRVYNRLLSNDEKEILCNNVQTGTNAITDTKTINIYPNPAKTLISIEADGINLNRIEIFDISGLKLKMYKQNNRIDISDIKSGIYLIKLIDTEGNIVKTEKIIKIN